MYKKKAVAVLLASAFSLALPLSGFAQQTGQPSTPGPQVAQAPAKSQQAIAAKQVPKRTAKKKVKRAVHRKRAAKRHA